MAELPGFGTLLLRLAAHRGVDVAALSMSLDEPDLAPVLEGAAPTSHLLRQLSPPLGIDASDLFVIAGLPVPRDLGPAHRQAAQWLPSIVSAVIDRPEHLHLVRGFARSLPRQPDPRASPAPAYERYPPCLGGLLLHLLHNRNLGWPESVRFLHLLAGVGPLSASTMGLVGHDKMPLTADLVAGVATVVGFPVAELAALVGTGPPASTWVAHPAASEVAGLIWDCRRLTYDQLRQVHRAAT